MLIELWEKFRGYDKWTAVLAKVVSTTVITGDSPAASQSLQVQIAWNGPDGTGQVGQFSADQESALYQLTEGEILPIRIDSQKPADFYVPGLLESDALALRRAVLIAIIIILAGVAYYLPEIIQLLSKLQ